MVLMKFEVESMKSVGGDTFCIKTWQQNEPYVTSRGRCGRESLFIYGCVEVQTVMNHDNFEYDQTMYVEMAAASCFRARRRTFAATPHPHGVTKTQDE